MLIRGIAAGSRHRDEVVPIDRSAGYMRLRWTYRYPYRVGYVHVHVRGDNEVLG